jgi:type IV pilus assembly protein PilA
VTTPRNSTRSQGFTLIELMIVVAIIGILAAIAIPNLLKFQLRSKASEGRVNLAGIRTAQASYFADAGSYVAWSSAPSAPGSPPGTDKWAWPPCSNFPPLSGDPGFCFIGWQPEGDVYFNYAVVTNGVSTISGAQYFAGAQSDIDGEGTLNLWGISKPDNSNNSLASGPYGCVSVLNPATGTTMLEQVGPCDDVSNGLTIF